MEKYILITGASSGIGEACARKFAANGHNLILLARRIEKLDVIKKDLEQKHAIQVLNFQLDVNIKNEVESFVGSLDEKVRSNIHALINNAGLALGRDPIYAGNIDDWERMIDTNIKGLLYISRFITPILKRNKAGHIFNISSIAGKEVYADGNVYCATKHAVDSLSKAMRIDLVDYNVKVTNIAPGAVETEFSMVRFKGDEEKAQAVYKHIEPLKGEDIAETIYFAFQLPQHVNINDLTIMPTVQASATRFKQND